MYCISNKTSMYNGLVCHLTTTTYYIVCSNLFDESKKFLYDHWPIVSMAKLYDVELKLWILSSFRQSRTDLTLSVWPSLRACEVLARHIGPRLQGCFLFRAGGISAFSLSLSQCQTPPVAKTTTTRGWQIVKSDDKKEKRRVDQLT